MVRMHDDELEIDTALARRLVDSQFPRWSGAEITGVETGGTDNAIFRLGRDLALRLPRTPAAALRLDKEHRWLPALAPHLPLAIPRPVEQGRPDHGIPWRWSVYGWIEGRTATPEAIADPVAAARQLGDFVVALHELDPAGGPAPGPHNSLRGVPLAARDATTREAIHALGDLIDSAAVTAAWEHALHTPVWSQPGVWIHGDLWETNLLVDDAGCLSAVIDFGCLGIGDPACDLGVAWNAFEGEARVAFERPPTSMPTPGTAAEDGPCPSPSSRCPTT